MTDISFYIFHYMYEFWRRRRSILIVMWVAGLVGALFVATLPDYFTSRSTILMDTRSILTRILGKQAVFEDPIQQVEQVRRIMYSRPSIEKLIRRSDLDLTVDTPQQMERLVVKMQESLILERQGDNFYIVEYENNDPAVAQTVVQNLLNLFIEQNIGQVGDKNQTAISYLNNQAEETQQRLSDIEDEIAAFVREHPDELIDVSSVSARKQSLENNIRSIRTEKQFITSEIAQLERELSGTPSRVSAGGNRGQSPRQARLAQLIQERDALLLRLTPQHPDVVALNNLIAQVQSSDDAPISDLGGVDNPIYAQLESQLRRTKNRLIALDTQLQNDDLALQNIIETMAKQPAVQQKYAKLEEDRRIIYQKLLQLKQQIEIADTSTSVTTDVNLVEFRVIEPPILALQPTGPNRFILLLGVAVGAVLAGLASAFVRIQISGTMPTLKHLKEHFAYPILGGVTRVDANRSASKTFQEVMVTISAIILFILVFVVLIHQFHTAGWRPSLNLRGLLSFSLSDLFTG